MLIIIVESEVHGILQPWIRAVLDHFHLSLTLGYSLHILSLRAGITLVDISPTHQYAFQNRLSKDACYFDLYVVRITYFLLLVKCPWEVTWHFISFIDSGFIVTYKLTIYILSRIPSNKAAKCHSLGVTIIHFGFKTVPYSDLCHL